MFVKTPKYAELISLYQKMVDGGYNKTDGTRVEQVYQTQEARKFRGELKPLFESHSVKSVLDYGAGGLPWTECQLPENVTLAEFLNVETYVPFEPSRNNVSKQVCDAVACFDVLEHVFIGDIGYVLNDIFSLAKRLVVINVACYPAQACLPNGENAHCTIRPPHWWKGAVDLVASAYPEVTAALYCTSAGLKVTRMPLIRFADVNSGEGFSR